jgi:hypothetical protein
MPRSEPAPPDLVTLAHAARLLGVSREAVRSRLKRAGIRCTLVAADGQSRYRWGEIRALFPPGPVPLVSLRRGPSSEALDQLERVAASMRERE